jgi:hypothetical protein
MRYVLGVLLVLLSISCIKPTQQNNEITKVELASSGAWSDPGAAISIDDSLNYKYYGLLNHNYSMDSFPHKRLYYEGKISSGFLDTLNTKLKQLKYKTLDTIDYSSVKDANSFELIIYWRNGKRRIVRIDTGGTDPVVKTMEWLNDSYKKVKLKPIQGPIKFETTIQISPPQPKFMQIKFPPPMHRKRY